jgi:uncharacterized protein YukJ
MPLHPYGVLKGRIIARRHGRDDDPHYQLHIKSRIFHYRAAINVRSKVYPSVLECVIIPQLRHPMLGELQQLPEDFHVLEKEPGGPALDYIRSNLFCPSQMLPVPLEKPGPNNDLNEYFDALLQQAMECPGAMAYVFGVRFGPNRKLRDPYFHFKPMLGLHDVHMNQGNMKQFHRDDGVYQDGGLILHLPGENRWAGAFLKFQSQSWHTHDRTGRRRPPGSKFQGRREHPFPEGFEPPVRIVSAMVNPFGGAPEVETVTLRNDSAEPLDLSRWEIRDWRKHSMKLAADPAGPLAPGSIRRVTLRAPVRLGNSGGLITLLDPEGRKIHGVAYDACQGKVEGEEIIF